MRPRLRALALNLAVSLLSLIVCLLAAEMALRLLSGFAKGGKEQLERDRYTEHDPLLGWRKTPGAHVVYDRRDYYSTFRINSRGLRGRERGHQKQAGVTRVLALGDSFVEAFMVGDDEMVTSRLEARLQDRGCRVEVINGGTIGYSSDQEYLFYREEGRKYAPEVVVTFVYHNDIPYLVHGRYSVYPKPLLSFDTDPPRVVNYPLPRYTPPAPSVPPPTPRPRSYLLEFVDQRLEHTSARTYNRLARLGLWKPLRQLPMNEELRLFRVPEMGHLRPAWSALTWTLEALTKAVSANGGHLVVAYIPSRMEVSRRHWEITEARYGLAGTSFDRGAVADRLRYITGRLGLPLLDLTPALSRVDGLLTPVYYDTDSHWNVLGQDVAAAELAEFLSSRGLLPNCR